MRAYQQKLMRQHLKLIQCAGAARDTSNQAYKPCPAMRRFMEELVTDTHTLDFVANTLMRRLEAGIMSINHVGGSIVAALPGGVESLDGYLIAKRVSFKH